MPLYDRLARRRVSTLVRSQACACEIRAGPHPQTWNSRRSNPGGVGMADSVYKVNSTPWSIQPRKRGTAPRRCAVRPSNPGQCQQVRGYHSKRIVHTALGPEKRRRDLFSINHAMLPLGSCAALCDLSATDAEARAAELILSWFRYSQRGMDEGLYIA